MAKRLTTITVRIESYYINQIQQYANKLGISKTAMARMCIEKSIDRNTGLTLEIPIDENTFSMLSEKASNKNMSAADLAGQILSTVLPII